MRDFFFFLPSFAAEEANIHFRLFKLIPVIHQKQFMYNHGHCWLLEICIMFLNNILKCADKLRARLLMSHGLHSKYQRVLYNTKCNGCLIFLLIIFLFNDISAFFICMHKQRKYSAN